MVEHTCYSFYVSTADRASDRRRPTPLAAPFITYPDGHNPLLFSDGDTASAYLTARFSGCTHAAAIAAALA